VRLVEGHHRVPDAGREPARDRVWGSFSTGGSRGIRESHLYVRKGGAVARQMLIQAAAEAWGVPDGRVPRREQRHHPWPSGRTTTYGQVASAAAELWPPEQVALKDPEDWKLIGQPVKRLDTADKLNGKQVFGADLTLPGMLNAAIKACPVFTGKLAGLRCGRCRPCPACARCGRSATTPWPWWPTPGGRPRPRWMPCRSPGTRAARNLSSADIDAMLDEGLTSDEQVFVGNARVM
jgi:isoquinoline 1-oxidoreductase beta subunit